MKPKTPFARRQKEAERLRHRYRTDEGYRLHKVNYSRRRNGKEPLSHVEQIGLEPRVGRFAPREVRA